jgi:CheY-like chemotaxis protein
MNQSAKTILCVDDEVGVVAALRRMLKPLSYRILTAKNGEEALLIVETTRPDLIILDVHMPKMSGYEVLKALKKKGFGEVPVVMLTGENSDEGVLKGYNEGCIYYITKPCKREYIFNIIEFLIGDPSPERKEWLEKHL